MTLGVFDFLEIILYFAGNSVAGMLQPDRQLLPFSE